LTRAEALRWLGAFLPLSVIGSAASNLYSTAFLKRFPFPTDFGHEGDAAWGVIIAPFVKLAVTPRVCADFVVHGRGHDLPAAGQAARFEQMAALARETFRPVCTDPELREVFHHLSAAWEANHRVWRWLAALDGIADTAEEQRKYIHLLEADAARLKREVELLGGMPVSRWTPFLQSKHMAGLLRPLKRWLRLSK
ncbi:MAG TPA: hypothetical protein VIS74_02850, partial [Chthoniobacterales bacterium]